VSAPALESVEPAVETAQTPNPAAAAARQPSLALRSIQRVSRATTRRFAPRPVSVALRAARRSEARESFKILTFRRAARAHRAGAEIMSRRAAGAHAAAAKARSKARAKRAAIVRRVTAAQRYRVSGRLTTRMAEVIVYARAQVGKDYRRGGEGPNSFDCSGFTKRAYAHAGLRLPHSSGAQAARARTISRAAARPGDLVVGPGHVGIYMGSGMMIDAGNPRTGVVYRRVYGGLHIERF
jgi:cell wall-associated NlpC family hydrolase